MTAVLDRTYEQKIDALAKANGVRIARARLKRDVVAGRVDVVDLLAWPVRAEVETMKVSDLLLAQFGWGRDKVRKFLKTIRVSDCKTVGGLSWRQRDEIVTALRNRNTTGSDPLGLGRSERGSLPGGEA